MNEYKLHDYQLVARDFLRGRDRCALFLDMGLGKTAASLSALEPRHLPALVVAPKRVAETVWHAERALWRPDLTIAVAKGEPAVRREALLSGADIVVVSRDNMGNDLFGLSHERKHPRFKTVIIDELSGYKNHDTARWRKMRDLTRRPSVEHVWGLTGTPAPNGYLDLFSQIKLLDGGQRLGKNIGGYRNRYFTEGLKTKGGTVISYDIRDGATERINGLIEDICLSMETEGRIKLPPYTINHLKFELPQKSRKAYNTISKDLVVDMKDLFGEDAEIHSAANGASLTSKLSQITAGFMFVDDQDIRDGEYQYMHSLNVDAVKEVVEANDTPVLIFYRFLPQKEMLAKAFPEASYADDEDVFDRWNAGEVPVLIAHPQSISHGLNIQHGGHTMVWASPTWSLEEWQQGIKRFIRQGQKHPVVIHIVMADGTIDQHIVTRVDGKDEVQTGLLNFLESPV